MIIQGPICATGRVARERGKGKVLLIGSIVKGDAPTLGGKTNLIVRLTETLYKRLTPPPIAKAVGIRTGHDLT